MTDLIHLLPDDMHEIRYLVLNGDIVDFKWTALPDVETTIEKAVDCVTDVMARYPHLDVHYILGNHDCHQAFIERLRELEDNRPSFFLHPYFLRMGDLFFLHGDCTNYYTRHADLVKKRASWQKVSKRHTRQAMVYEMADKSGMVRLFHHLYFPKKAVARRALYYLGSLPGGMPEGVREIFIGHSHIPFTRFEYKNYCFHNSGCGINGMRLNPVYFVTETNP